MTPPPLEDRELAVLLSVTRLGTDAYGLPAGRTKAALLGDLAGARGEPVARDGTHEANTWYWHEATRAIPDGGPPR